MTHVPDICFQECHRELRRRDNLHPAARPEWAQTAGEGEEVQGLFQDCPALRLGPESDADGHGLWPGLSLVTEQRFKTYITLLSPLGDHCRGRPGDLPRLLRVLHSHAAAAQGWPQPLVRLRLEWQRQGGPHRPDRARAALQVPHLTV